jgi:hypothetical protein
MHALRTLTATAFALIFAATLARPQSLQTTTVTGTVYAAGGAPVSGSLQISWPAFTTAAGQAIAAGHVNVTIANNGQISVLLAPNIGASPAGLYYTAVYHLADGTTSTEYWVVPNSIQTTIGQVRAKVMPAAQAVQAVSKSYVDQSIAEAVTSQITPSGGTLTGPLYLAGDPTEPAQASNRHYVDEAVAGALPITGGTVTGPVTATKIGAVYQADQFPGADFGAKLQACINALDPSYGGTCDARNFAGSLTMASNLNLSAANATVNLPCSTIATAASIVVPASTRNVTLHGCASRGTSAASGAQGGTVFLYSGSTALMQVGDPSFVADTKGFRLDNAALNTTAAQAASAQAIAIYRTQEVSLAGLYLLGNANQTAIVLDGTGNYTGGTLEDLQITGYQTGVSGIGHTVSNPATTDWLNASTLMRVHIDCPTQSGNPIGGTIGIDLNAGDGNTITGGDVESCSTALHLGPQAENNTILGLRNENSTTQIQADPGSSYNNWITGGTMFTGKLVDQGTRNSFLDTFHRSFNGLNGDWWGSQQDATVTNHYRLGTGTGNERGMLDRFQTDSGYRWTTGLSDAASGIQYYQVLDELNNVYRLSIGQYNNGQAGSNNQTAINAAGAGAVILNGSNNAGTGGVVIGSGGPSSTTVATIDKSGNAHFTGTMLIDQTAQSSGTVTVRNNADAEVDYYLWPGATASQKGSFTYKDFNGASQWYLVKDQNNNWALNSAVGGLDSFKAYQSTNSGDTYINASNAGGHIRLNYETGAGAETDIYGGSSTSLSAAFLGPTAIKLPGLAASSGTNCLQIDNTGYITNTTTPCSTGSGNVGSGSTGQIAYYTANGTAIAGTTTVPLANGGTGAATAAAALANLLPGVTADGASGFAVQGSAVVKGNAQFQGPVAVASAGVTFSDSSVQTTSQQGALTGAANDSAARIAASSAQTTANAALPANGISTSTTGGGSLSVPGTVAATATVAQTSQNVPLADQFPGADCGAKVQACINSLGASAGKCQVTQACGTNWTTPVTISNRSQGIEFTQPGGMTQDGVSGVYSLCAPITLSGMGDFLIGIPSGAYRSIVSLRETAGCNLSSVVSATGSYFVMRDIGVDGNGANNPTGQDSVDVDSSSRVRFTHVNLINARRDNLHVTSSGGVNQSCCGHIDDSFLSGAGNDDFYLTDGGDWFSSNTEYESAGNLGIEAVNAGSARIIHGDFGGNAKGGISVVETGGTGQNNSSQGWTITGGSQLRSNCGPDIFIDGNPSNATSGYTTAGIHVIVGNSFAGLAASCTNTGTGVTYTTPTGASAPDSIRLHDAGNTTIAGNQFTGQTAAPFNYGVNITGTLTNQQPTTVSANNFTLSGFNQPAPQINPLASGIDSIGPNTFGNGNGAEFFGKMLLDAPAIAGTGSTATPNFYFNCPGATPPGNWNTAGTLFGGNLCNSDNRDLISFRVNGGNTPAFLVSNSGTVIAARSYQLNTSGFGTTLQLSQNGASFFNTGHDFSVGTASDLGFVFGVQGTLGATQYAAIPATVTASSTPALVASNGLQTITLSANATPTVSGIATGQRLTMRICQPSSGGPYTWTWPSAFHGGMTIGTAANTCSIQTFDSYNGSTLVAEDAGITGVSP